MLEFSCADYAFPLLSRAQTLQLLRLLQFAWVDIGLFERNSHFLPSALMASHGGFTIKVVEELQSVGLGIADVFLQIGLDPAESSANDPESAVRARNREVFSRALSFCHTVGSTHLTGLPGVPHGSPGRDLELAVEEAAWRVEQCRPAGIVYAIEPHIGSICAATESTVKLLSLVENLTLTLDYGHFLCLGESSAAVHPLLQYASHLHVRGAAPGRLQTSVEENAIDFSGMVAALAALQYRGKLAVEYVWTSWQGCNRSDNLSETVLLRQRLREIAAGKQPV